MQHFASMGHPVPWKVLVRESAGYGTNMFCIATFNTVAQANAVMSLRGLRWPDHCHMVVK